jgi:hypothetical protein
MSPNDPQIQTPQNRNNDLVSTSSEQPNNTQSYKKGFKFALLISALYFGSIGLILLASYTINFMFAWFLLAPIMAFPVYLASVTAIFANTFGNKHPKRVIGISLLLGAISLIIEVGYILSLKSADIGIFSIADGVSLVLSTTAVILAVKGYEKHRFLSVLAILLALSFYPVGQTCLHFQRDKLYKQNLALQEMVKKKQAETEKKQQEEYDKKVKARKEATNKQVDENFKLLKSPFMVPPEKAGYKIDPSSFKIKYENADTNKPYGLIYLRKGEQIAVTLTSGRFEQQHTIYSGIKSCYSALSSTDSQHACAYHLTTPRGIKVAKFDSYAGWYAFVENGSYQEFALNGTFDNKDANSDTNIANFIDTLVPASVDTFKLN